MKNNSSIILIASVILIVGLGIFFLNKSNQKNDDKMMKASDSMVKVEDDQALAPDDSADMMMKDSDENANDDKISPEDSMENDKQAMMKQDSYVEFTPQNLISAEGIRRVLFFYANWCPTCKPVDIELEENMSMIPSDVKIIKVNYNDTDTDQAEKDLAKKYNVTYQHTFVEIDEDGNAVKTWNGGSLEDILNKLK
ncbi:thioredoxin family protein [Candidatus Woesebacteria bacterium]|nr:thioredoxin family protein [Candidatus Woesebacteria bacterium]